MNRIICAVVSILLGTATMAQLSFGGEPYGIKAEKNGMHMPITVKLPAVDVSSLMAEDDVKSAAGEKGPYRFGYNHAVDHSLNNSGSWNVMPNGDRVWSFTASSKGALSINLEFSNYVIPQGAKVFVYNDAHEFVGGFTAESNPSFTTMGVTPLPGDRITVEYVEPASVAGQGQLTIGQITHAYRDIFDIAKGLGDSGACNNNVICPEADNWRDQIRSVAMIVVGGGGICTGTLLNNCNSDGTPYFLTANHCLSSSTANWVFRFNWDSPTCTPTANGPTNQSVSGAQTLVANANSDVGLLQLNSTPPASYNVYYSGWDNSGTTPTASTSIHHPSGDIKKITFDYNAAGQGVAGGAQSWHIFNWEDGTTEGGSSGSGLWDQNGRLIGQLFGGQASCGNNVNDYYGRFDVSWPLLQTHLGNCGATLDGYDPNATQVSFDALVQSIGNIPNSTCNSSSIQPFITIKNSGTTTLTSVTINYDVDGISAGSFNWTGSLATGQTDDIQLGAINTTNGPHTFTASSSNPNGNADQNPANDSKSKNFIIVDPGLILDVNITLDTYGSETTWEVTNTMNDVLYMGGPYQDNMNMSVESTSICLGLGCYNFTIFDSYGDGICCAYGTGSYEIVDATGFQYVTGDGQFVDDMTHNFCITSLGVENADELSSMTIAPNPSNGTFLITIPSLKEQLDIMVRDAIGRLVHTQRVNAGSQSFTMDLTSLEIGTYTLQFAGTSSNAIRKVVLNR